MLQSNLNRSHNAWMAAQDRLTVWVMCQNYLKSAVGRMVDFNPKLPVEAV